MVLCFLNKVITRSNFKIFLREKEHGFLSYLLQTRILYSNLHDNYFAQKINGTFDITPAKMISLSNILKQNEQF